MITFLLLHLKLNVYDYKRNYTIFIPFSFLVKYIKNKHHFT